MSRPPDAVDLRWRGSGIDPRFRAYVEPLRPALGHADRLAAFQAWCAGLLLPGGRERVTPQAAQVAPGRVQAVHRSLHHIVAKAHWDDATLCIAADGFLIRERAANPPAPAAARFIGTPGLPGPRQAGGRPPAP